MKPGIYSNITAEQYHADPCDVPSLSHSIAKVIADRSAEHGAAKHPRLNQDTAEKKKTRAMDDGSILHEMLLGKGGGIVPLTSVYGPKHKKAGQAVTDFMTDVAKEEAEAIREAGGIPVTINHLEELRATAARVEAKMRRNHRLDAFFAPGTSEAVIIYEHEGVTHRMMVDRLPDDPDFNFFDLKFTDLSAQVDDYERRFQTSYATQEVFYETGVNIARPEQTGKMVFIVIELLLPHGISLMRSKPILRDAALSDMTLARRRWRHGITTGEWSGYDERIASIDCPPWLHEKKLMRAAMELVK